MPLDPDHRIDAFVELMTEGEMDQTRAFYDELSADYHLVYEDWWAGARRQAAALHALVEEALGPGPWRILDCTAGIGTQALGLADLGHHVLGTDLSSGAVQRARREARERELDVDFRVADVRRLSDGLSGPFDVVLSADNSLPHLTEPGELEQAVREMWTLTAPGGLVLVTLRDYDALLVTRPSIEAPRILGSPGSRRIVLQLWDWLPDEPVYELHLLLLREEKGWATRAHRSRYRAVTRAELEACFRPLGGEGRWHEPDASGFFQPVYTVAR